MSTEASRRATAERAERHREEVAMQRQRGDRYRSVAIIEFFVALIVFAFAVFTSYEAKKPWRTDNPPVEVKLKVVTYGWYNKKGEWQSYDCGEVIQIQQWKP